MNQTKKQFPQSQSQTIWDGCDIPVHLELEDLEPRFILSRRVALFWSEVHPRLRNASAIGVDNVPARVALSERNLTNTKLEIGRRRV